MPLKDEHINLLKKPFGSLIKQEDISKEKILYFDLMPNLAIIDGIERRIKKSELEMVNLKNTFLTKNHIYNQYQCKNTKGTISKEAYLTIKKILFEEEQAIIFID